MILCYVAWGDRVDLYIESVFSILTFLPDPGVSAICVVAEKPEYYAPVRDRIRLVPVDSATLAEWGGEKNFQYRKKIRGIDLVASLYPGQDILFLDTDTFHGGSMDAVAAHLAAGRVCMGDSYGYISKAMDRNNRELYAKIRGRDFCGYHADEKSMRFNSGNVGLPAASARAILADALDMCDAIHDLTGYYGTEEIAISFAMGKYALGNRDKVVDIGAIVGHYWGNKALWDLAIREFFAHHAVLQSPLEEMIAAARKFDTRKIPTYTHKPRHRKTVERWAARFWPFVRTRYFPEQPKPWW
jgi:hypothetical protein